MSQRGTSTTARGYGSKHQRLRRALVPQVASGTVRCARGSACRFAVDGLGGLIAPGEEWDLGHDDHDRRVYTGPEHRVCNRATSSRREPARSRAW